jgi:hypothetical protein
MRVAGDGKRVLKRKVVKDYMILMTGRNEKSGGNVLNTGLRYGISDVLGFSHPFIGGIFDYLSSELRNVNDISKISLKGKGEIL